MPPASPPRPAPRPLPLDGIVVVAIEQAVAAPLATRHLADLGARVIKLERSGTGDFARHYDHVASGVSAYFAWLNRSKESVVVDLKAPAGIEVVERLVERADVFVQNLAPGAADRLGLAAEQLHERHPRLIACDVSGYGPGGPYGDRKAYDLLIQAETGLVSITGSEDVPSKAGISVADISGGMYAFSGILAALFERERTGAGAALEVSLFDGLTEWMAQPAYLALYGEGAPPRAGASHASVAPYGPHATRDGAVVFAVQHEREWEAFCTFVLLQPDLALDPRFASNEERVRHRSALTESIDAVLTRLDTSAVEERLASAGIAYAVARTPDELVEHPQVVARGRRRVVGGPEGELMALLPPFSLGGREPRMGPVPALGEHTEAVLAWLDEGT